MTTKEAFLGRLREAVAGGVPAPHRPLVPLSAPPEVTPAWKDPSAPLVDRWTAAFEALGGHVRRTGRDGVAAAVEQALAGRGPVLVDERALGHLRPAPGDSPPGSLPGHLLHRVVGESPPGASHDNSVHDVPLVWPGCGLDAAATATGGVIEATAGIAATGSIVVDTARNGRLVSLLPRVAVFVLRSSTIVPLAGDVLRRHAERWPDGPPANVVLITGPSRSGDIEMSLVVGVHGPGEVHAVVVDDL